MTGDLIILDTIGDREAAALIVGGRLHDLLVETDAPRPGTVYRAIADRPVKGQGGMFLRTPDGPAFLRQVKGIAPGDTLLVQVTGYAESGKALPVTQKILFKSRFAIVTPGARGFNISRSIHDEDLRDSLLEIAHNTMDSDTGFGLILRSACADADPDEIARDIADMADLASGVMRATIGEAQKLADGDGPHVMAWRDWANPAQVITEDGGFEHHGVLDQIDALDSPLCSLSNGASMYVEPTRALVAVDINTGSDTSPAAGLKANLAAARDLPRQLRIRGLGGQITLDLAPMPKKDRRTFETALRTAFRPDSIDTTLVGWTPLGHFELQRKRARLPYAG